MPAISPFCLRQMIVSRCIPLDMINEMRVVVSLAVSDLTFVRNLKSNFFENLKLTHEVKTYVIRYCTSCNNLNEFWFQKKHSYLILASKYYIKKYFLKKIFFEASFWTRIIGFYFLYTVNSRIKGDCLRAGMKKHLKVNASAGWP